VHREAVPDATTAPTHSYDQPADMALDSNQLQHLAKLARIRVDATELAQLRDQLNGIFVLIEKMQAVDTRDVEPMAHAQEMRLRLRDDRVTEADQRERFQSIAPAVEQGLYLVPKVIE
jgi:aspartyl-tRNA(Asn)/glutamyl-tRNA(Gln) amidotransferase subunit C